MRDLHPASAVAAYLRLLQPFTGPVMVGGILIEAVELVTVGIDF